MIIDDISSLIKTNININKLTLVSICGAADLGKSYLSRSIVQKLHTKDLTVNHLTMDSYLLDRNTRIKKGLSGYNIESYDLIKSINDLNDLKKGKTINYSSYNHEKGRKNLKLIKIDSSDILIFDAYILCINHLQNISILHFFYTRVTNF